MMQEQQARRDGNIECHPCVEETYFLAPLFIGPLILAAHSDLTSILNVIPVRQYGLYFYLIFIARIFCPLFPSCISISYLSPGFISCNSVLYVFLSRISILYLSLSFEVHTEA